MSPRGRDHFQKRSETRALRDRTQVSDRPLLSARSDLRYHPLENEPKQQTTLTHEGY